MQSKKLSFLKDLAKKLKNLLKKYDSIYDFVIFGSWVKDKLEPNDLDVAMIVHSPETAFIGEIKTAIDKEIRNAHLQVVQYSDFIKSKLPYQILAEGYSVKGGAFIADKLKISKKILYMFVLESFTQVEKVMFNKALKSLIQKTKSEKAGRGAVLVAIRSSGEFEDFFDLWKMKIRKKEFIEVG